MKIKGVSLTQLVRAVADVSGEFYQDNVTFNQWPESVRTRRGRATPWVRFTLRVHFSSGPGARVSRGGRRMVSACWHAHRDVLAHLFYLYPDAVCDCGMAGVVYDGAASFARLHRGTATQNKGSRAAPLAHADACECAG